MSSSRPNIHTTPRRPAETEASFRRCLYTGICALAFPFSGVCVALIMTFAVPSRYLYNQLSYAFRIYAGLTLLLPIPLFLVSLFFFTKGITALRRDPTKKGLPSALIGLAASVTSVAAFVLTVTFFPVL